jgi:hypothetical protein
VIALLAALSLHLAPARTASASPELWLTQKLFASDSEATNFSAHCAWGAGLPLAGYAVAGKKGAAIASGAWAAYSLVNEFAWHPPESGRERALNLSSRLGSAALVTGLLLLFGKD